MQANGQSKLTACRSASCSSSRRRREIGALSVLPAEMPVRFSGFAGRIKRQTCQAAYGYPGSGWILLPLASLVPRESKLKILTRNILCYVALTQVPRSMTDRYERSDVEQTCSTCQSSKWHKSWGGHGQHFPELTDKHELPNWIEDVGDFCRTVLRNLRSDWLGHL